MALILQSESGGRSEYSANKADYDQIYDLYTMYPYTRTTEGRPCPTRAILSVVSTGYLPIFDPRNRITREYVYRSWRKRRILDYACYKSRGGIASDIQLPSKCNELLKLILMVG